MVLPFVHPIVYYGIDHGIRHGQPVETQVHVLHIFGGCDIIIVVRINEKHMIGQPANSKN